MHARPPSPPAVEIVSHDGRSWDALLREMQSDPTSFGRVYQVGVRSRGARVLCGDYDLSLDGAAAKAFAIEGCDVETAETRIRVIDRSALFDPGDFVPTPRIVTVHALVRQTGTATGGGDAPTAGSKIWCSVALQPYLWDGLRGVAVSLPPDRFDLIPKDEHIHAAPDGSGWIAHGESRMDVFFRYEVRDRATGTKILEDVATLACADTPIAALPQFTGPTLPGADAARFPSPAGPSWSQAVVRDRSATMGFDVRSIAGGVILGASNVQQELAGAQVGMGGYLSNRWFLGGSARWILIMNNGGLTQLLQVGPELRYTLHASQGSGAKGRVVTSRHWLGLRTGFEDVGPGTEGGFGEVSWGWDMKSGHFIFGTVVSFGTGFDAPGAYGYTTVVHP
ncbi:MAG: hypothetical protein ACLQVI_37590, partial [Polyangiaceae bacterium]